MPALTRQTFQHGSLTTESRNNGNDVWVFRWRETGPEGQRVRRKVIVGTKQQYPTKAKAEKAAASLRLDISKEQPERIRASVTVAQLAAPFREKELGVQTNPKSYSTRKCYKTMIDLHILPRWGNYRLGDVRTVAVEDWLRGLTMANGSKAKVRNVFHALYSHAERYEWHDRNPITKVRQSAKRQKDPDILDAGELTGLLTSLPDPFRTMVFVAGLRSRG